MLSLLPSTLIRNGEVLEYDPGVCGVGQRWKIRYRNKEYLLVEKYESSCPMYPRGAINVRYYEIFVKDNGKWKKLEVD